MKKGSKPSGGGGGVWDVWAAGLAGTLLRSWWTGLWGPFWRVAAVPLAAVAVTAALKE